METFNLANIYSAGEAIKGQRSRNELLEQKRGEEDTIRKTAQAAVNPQTGELDVQRFTNDLARQGYVDRAEQIRTGYIDRLNKGANYLNSMLPYVNESTYPQFKAKLEESGMAVPGAMPERFNAQEFARGVALLNGKLSQTQQWGPLEQVPGAPEGTLGQRNLTTGKVDVPVKPGVDPLVYTDEGYTPRSQAGGMKRPPPASEQSKPFSFKATDSNTIYRQAVGLFGGMYDPISGHIGGLNPEQSTQAQQIASRASQLYSESQGQVDHATAVSQAFEELKQDPSGPRPQGSAESAPPANALKPGVVTDFANGQSWTLDRDGKPQRVQ